LSEAGLYLQKALENLVSARAELESNRYDAATNRAYFAAFQAAIAAAIDQGFSIERPDHTKVQVIFNGELINRRRVYPASLRGLLDQLESMRVKADYRPYTVGRRGATEAVRRAAQFVQAVRGKLEKGED